MFKFKNLFILLFSLGFSGQALAKDKCGYIVPYVNPMAANRSDEIKAKNVKRVLILEKSCTSASPNSPQITNENREFILKFKYNTDKNNKSYITFSEETNIPVFSVIGLSSSGAISAFNDGNVPASVSELINKRVNGLKKKINPVKTGTEDGLAGGGNKEVTSSGDSLASSDREPASVVGQEGKSTDVPQDSGTKASTQADTTIAYTSESTKKVAEYQQSHQDIVAEEAKFYNDDGSPKYNYSDIINKPKMFEDFYSESEVGEISAHSESVSEAKNKINHNLEVMIKPNEKVKLVINNKINPKVNEDTLLYTKDESSKNLLREQQGYIDTYNELSQQEIDLKNKFTDSVLEKKEKILESAKEETADNFYKAYENLENENQSLAVCKNAKYQAFCNLGEDGLTKECDGSDKEPSYCSACEIYPEHKKVPEVEPFKASNECSVYANQARNNDPELESINENLSQAKIEQDNEIDSSQNFEAAQEEVSSEYLEIAKAFNPASRCVSNGLFLAAATQLLNNKDTSLGISHFLGSKYSDNGRPQAKSDPMECASNKEGSDFQYEKGLEFYTNLKQNYLKKLSRTGNESLCLGLAYKPSSYASNELGFEDASCNDLLVGAISFCQVNSTDRKVSSAAEIQDLIRQAGSEEELKSRKGYSSTSRYRSVGLCKNAYLEKFKACMGGSGKDLNKFNESDSPDIETKVISGVLNNQIRKNVAEEVQRQYGVCHSFRELGRDSFEKYGDWEGTESMRSIDGQYTCSRVAPWTQDFRGCMRLIHTYNGFLAGKQGLDIMSTAATIKESTKISQDAAEQMAEGDQLNAGLDAQKKTYELQRDKERANLAFHGAKAATLTGMILNFPTPNSVSRKCSEGSEDSSINPAFFCEAAKYWQEDADTGGKVRDEQVFPNQDVKNRMWMEVMKSGADAALAALKQSQLNKMAGDVQLVKEAFNGLEDNSTTSDSQIELSYCKFNPSAPSCQNSGERVSYGGGFSYGNVTSQGAGGESYSIGQTDEAFGEYDENLDSEAKRQAIEDLGGIIDNTVADSFDGSFDAPGAGKLGKGSLGGGGGGSGGAGGGGGGGGAPGKAKSGKQNNFAPTKTGLSGFSSGTSSSFASGGSKSKSKSKNPFSSMFGSKKGRTVASKVTNDIAPANSMLFDKISKRYDKVNAENRLINLQNLSK